MTVRELIETLQEYDSDSKIYLMEERDEFEATVVYEYLGKIVID